MLKVQEDRNTEAEADSGISPSHVDGIVSKKINHDRNNNDFLIMPSKANHCGVSSGLESQGESSSTTTTPTTDTATTIDPTEQVSPGSIPSSPSLGQENQDGIITAASSLLLQQLVDPLTTSATNTTTTPCPCSGEEGETQLSPSDAVSSASLNRNSNQASENKSRIETMTRYSDGSVRLRNPHIELMDQDILYHLALGSESHDLIEMFRDVRFVCIGGTPKRMEEFAYFIMREIGHKIPAGTQLLDISQYSYRYSMYKVGPVLSVSHGMGIPSVSILLHEVIKLMYHAKARDPVFFRIGTCGGVGIDGGSVIITEEALNAELKPYHEITVLGKKVRRPSKLDKRLRDELLSLAHEKDNAYDTITGKTMCTDDFYEGQARLDGCICEYTEKEKMSYILDLSLNGVTNIEMESLAFAALTHHAGIRAAVVCVSLLDRLKGDQVLAAKEVLNEWQLRPQILIAQYIKRELGLLPPHRKSPINISSIVPCHCPHSATLRVKSPRRMHVVQQESESYD